MVLSSLLATPAIPCPGKENMRGSLEKTKTHDNGDQEWKMPSANAKKHYEGKFY